ncbi:MAG: NUDIX domain-containing protein [Armatimonadetes bacterium]|nr:NUDIX domain-containing protein [Armatimonadota bacterium]
MPSAPIRVSAYVLLEDAGKVLLCRLSESMGDSAGKWTLPGGGLDFGEHPEEAALREVMEETGLEARIDGFAAFDNLVMPVAGVPTHAVRILFHGSVIGGELRPEQDGSTDTCAWFCPDEAATMPLVELAEAGLVAWRARHREGAK